MQARGCSGLRRERVRGGRPVLPQTAADVHRCYGWVARRHLVAGGLAALPVAFTARAAAAVAWNRPDDAITVDRADIVPGSVSVIFLIVGVTAWGLIEHLMVHWRATHAAAQTRLDSRWFVDRYGRWWYQP